MSGLAVYYLILISTIGGCPQKGYNKARNVDSLRLVTLTTERCINLERYLFAPAVDQKACLWLLHRHNWYRQRTITLA